MINQRTGKLSIFANFQYLKDQSKNKRDLGDVLQDTMRKVAQQIVDYDEVHPEDLFIFEGELRTNKTRWVYEKASGLRALFSKRPKIDIKEVLSNPLKFFKDIKKSVQEIKTLETDDVSRVDTLLKYANDCHQQALVEKLEKERTRIERELKMLEIGVKTFITEDDLVKFALKETKKLKLDWIKNFVRFIPIELQEIVVKTYDKDIFDNYVILHYDPDGNGSKLTKKEEEMKKDPILFGVIKESHKLYYLGDWIDKYCDLTLDKLMDTINEDYKNRQLKDNIL